MATTIALRKRGCSLALSTASFLKNAAGASAALRSSSKNPPPRHYSSTPESSLISQLSPTPVLLYPHSSHDINTNDQKPFHRLYSLVDDKVVDFQCPIPDEILPRKNLGPCNTTSLAAISSRDCSIFIYHPFIQTIYFLPPFKTLPFINESFSGNTSYTLKSSSVRYASHHLSDNFVKKVIVSRRCFAICGSKREASYCSHGDCSWEDFGSLIYGYQYYDFVHFKDEIYYALARSNDQDLSHCVLRYDFSNKESIKVNANALPIPLDNEWILKQKCCTKRYLVKSGGDILMIVRYFHNLNSAETNRSERVYMTYLFDVLKLNFAKDSCWEMVKSIGDYALFLGHNNTFSLKTSSHQGLKKNSIYFTNDEIEEYSSESMKMLSDDNHDFGVFNIGDSSIKSCYYPSCFQKIHPPPVWLVLTENIKKFFDPIL